MHISCKFQNKSQEIFAVSTNLQGILRTIISSVLRNNLRVTEAATSRGITVNVQKAEVQKHMSVEE